MTDRANTAPSARERNVGRPDSSPTIGDAGAHGRHRQSPSPNTTNRDQALTTELLKRADAWKAAVARAQRLSTERAVDLADATQLANDYRLLAHDLARARRLIPDTRTREFLEAAYVRAHGTLY